MNTYKDAERLYIRLAQSWEAIGKAEQIIPDAQKRGKALFLLKQYGLIKSNGSVLHFREVLSLGLDGFIVLTEVYSQIIGMKALEEMKVPTKRTLNKLERAGYIKYTDTRYKITPKGMQALGKRENV